MIKPIVADKVILHTVSEKIEGVSDELKQLAQDMIDTVAHHKAIGLAAIQLGAPVRMIYVAVNPGLAKIMINPIIRKEEKLTTSFKEGCLSENKGNTRVDKKRYKRIVVEYYDIDGQPQMYKAHNLEAFCIQHEIDHCNGKLLTENAA